jgi:hypothetical protein
MYSQLLDGLMDFGISLPLNSHYHALIGKELKKREKDFNN